MQENTIQNEEGTFADLEFINDLVPMFSWCRNQLIYQVN